MAGGAVYRAELPAQLRARLGVVIEPDGPFFKLRDVSQDLCAELSKRRHDIERVMAERGVSGPIAASIVALDTRQVKEHVAREILFEDWHKTGLAHSWSTEQAKLALHQQEQTVDLAEARKKVLSQALKNITQQQSIFSEREFLQAVAEAAPAASVSNWNLRALASVSTL